MIKKFSLQVRRSPVAHGGSLQPNRACSLPLGATELPAVVGRTAEEEEQHRSRVRGGTEDERGQVPPDEPFTSSYKTFYNRS